MCDVRSSKLGSASATAGGYRGWGAWHCRIRRVGIDWEVCAEGVEGV